MKRSTRTSSNRPRTSRSTMTKTRLTHAERGVLTVVPEEEFLAREIEELEVQICEDIEWGVRPGIAIRERCREAMEKAQREGKYDR